MYNIPRQDIYPIDVCGLIKLCDVDCCKTQLPEQVHLSGNSDNTMMYVAWVQSKSYATPVVQYGLSQSSLNLIGNAHVHTYTSGNWKGFIYNATLYNLQENTRYYYRVGSDIGGWSPVYKFKTFVNSLASYQSTTTTWAVIGDMGTNHESDATIAQLKKLVAADQIVGILHNGDIAYADGVQRRVRFSSCLGFLLLSVATANNS